MLNKVIFSWRHILESWGYILLDDINLNILIGKANLVTIVMVNRHSGIFTFGLAKGHVL